MQEETEQPDTLSLLSKLLLCCCKRKCWVVTESLDKNVYPVPFRWYQFLFGVLGIIVYVFDVGSDIILAYQYQEIEMWTAFILSTTFIVFPFLVSNTIIVYFDFYFDNNQRIALRRRDCESMSRVCCIPTMCTCPMMLGQIVSNIEYMYYGWRSRCVQIDDERRQYIYGLKEQHHLYVCIIRMMESFIEAVPQLIFQLYFILTETDRSTSDEESLLKILRPAAMLGSWLAITMAPFFLFKTRKKRKNNIRQQSISTFGLMNNFILRGCEIAPRIILFALFASEFHSYTLIIILLHWIAMIVFVKFQIYERPFTFHPMDNWLLFFVSYVMIFTSMNVRGRQKYINHIIYYTITYTENIAMLIVWRYYTSDSNQWYYLVCIIVIPVLMLLNIVLRLCYYRFCHPKRRHSCVNGGKLQCKPCLKRTHENLDI